MSPHIDKLDPSCVQMYLLRLFSYLEGHQCFIPLLLLHFVSSDVTCFESQSYFLIFLLHFRFLFLHMFLDLNSRYIHDVTDKPFSPCQLQYLLSFVDSALMHPLTYLLPYKKIHDPVSLIILCLTMFLIMLYLLRILVFFTNLSTSHLPTCLNTSNSFS